MPHKQARPLSKEEREERARLRAEDGAIATAEYHAATRATIARIDVLRRQRLAKEARERTRQRTAPAAQSAR